MCMEVSDSCWSPLRSLWRCRNRGCRGSGEHLPTDGQLFSVPKGVSLRGSEDLYWRDKAVVLTCAHGDQSLSLLLLTPMHLCTLMLFPADAWDFCSHQTSTALHLPESLKDNKVSQGCLAGIRAEQGIDKRILSLMLVLSIQELVHSGGMMVSLFVIWIRLMCDTTWEGTRVFPGAGENTDK